MAVVVISQPEAGGASPSVATLQRFLDALGSDLELGISVAT
jgi:hypothetical protein